MVFQSPCTWEPSNWRHREMNPRPRTISPFLSKGLDHWSTILYLVSYRIFWFWLAGSLSHLSLSPTPSSLTELQTLCHKIIMEVIKVTSWERQNIKQRVYQPGAYDLLQFCLESSTWLTKVSRACWNNKWRKKDQHLEDGLPRVAAICSLMVIATNGGFFPMLFFFALAALIGGKARETGDHKLKSRYSAGYGRMKDGTFCSQTMCFITVDHSHNLKLLWASFL